VAGSVQVPAANLPLMSVCSETVRQEPDKQRFALVDENYNPDALRQLRDSLPRVPGFPQWQIARTEPDLYI
jgi:hypothetical protein